MEVTQNSMNQLSSTFAMIADSAFTNIEQRANDAVNKIMRDAETKMALLVNTLPILQIKIDDIPTIKLDGQAVPYLDRMIVNAKLGLNTLLVGPAGCGKTTAARQLSTALNLQFGSVCLTAGASETWLFGRQTPNGFIEGSFSKIYKEGGVFLADEMDAADANLLLSINTALANGQMFNPMSGETIERHKDFIFIGAANTFGKGADHIYTGRSRLDGATLDRFIIIEVNYDSSFEKMICVEPKIYNFLSKLREKLLSNGLEEFISTRWFDYAYKLHRGGIKASVIKDTISANWSDEAKRICDDIARKEMKGLKAPKTISLEFEIKDDEKAETETVDASDLINNLQ